MSVPASAWAIPLTELQCCVTMGLPELLVNFQFIFMFVVWVLSPPPLLSKCWKRRSTTPLLLHYVYLISWFAVVWFMRKLSPCTHVFQHLNARNAKNKFNLVLEHVSNLRGLRLPLLRFNFWTSALINLFIFGAFHIAPSCCCCVCAGYSISQMCLV